MNIENLTIDELVSLRECVSTRLESLVTARQEELKAEADRLSGLTTKTVLKAPKYVHPNDRDVYGPKRTWHGRGSKPRWVQEWMREGGTLEQLKGAA